MLSGIKRQGIVGKQGKIEIQTPELAEGTVVEIIILVEQDVEATSEEPSAPQDTTEYLLSTEANRHHLMRAIQQVEANTDLVSFTLEEWDEEHHLHS